MVVDAAAYKSGFEIITISTIYDAQYTAMENFYFTYVDFVNGGSGREAVSEEGKNV